MNVEVSVDGRPWSVALEPAEQPGQFAITIKGSRRVVDVSWIDADTLSLLDGATAREIRIHRGANGAVGIEIGGRIYEAVVSPKRGREGFSPYRDRKIPPDPFSGPPSGSHTIKAPMPGRVVRVLVAIGDRVAAHQGIVVVEAMKMENELRTPRAGTVKKIDVAAGATVDAGAVLVLIGD